MKNHKVIRFDLKNVMGDEDHQDELTYIAVNNTQSMHVIENT